MKGYIYRIIDNTNGNIYYGSTINKINIRLTKHKTDYKGYLEGNRNYTTSFSIIKNNNYKYELVEEVECETKYELYTRERYYIENNICVNKQVPNRTRIEYYKDNIEYFKEYDKEYRKINKEIKRLYDKEYGKEYYKNNLEKIKEYRKVKVSCECGVILNRECLSRHKKTKKHLNKII